MIELKVEKAPTVVHAPAVDEEPMNPDDRMIKVRDLRKMAVRLNKSEAALRLAAGHLRRLLESNTRDSRKAAQDFLLLLGVE